LRAAGVAVRLKQGRPIANRPQAASLPYNRNMRMIVLSIAAAMAYGQTGTLLEVTTKGGRQFYSLPDEKGVVAEARKNLEADPKNVDLLMKLEAAQSAVWQNREAVETCTRVLKIDPDNAAALLERGHRELGLREFAQARDDLKRAMTLDPKKVDVYYHLGLAHYFLGEFSQSAEAFRHAVDLASSTDSRINSSNWLYASLRRAKKTREAAEALAAITPEMKNTADHTLFYLNLVRFFQGRLPEADAVPPEPPAGNTDTEMELRFDTVGYGVGNWYLYNGEPEKAREYFSRVSKGHVWVTWGFIGAETDLRR
jgi:tetratricopeptide (TPR) repeat protein